MDEDAFKMSKRQLIDLYTRKRERELVADKQ